MRALVVLCCVLLLRSATGSDPQTATESDPQTATESDPQITPQLEPSHPVHYAVLIPAEIHFPHTEQACVHLSDLKESAHLRVTLQLREVNLTLVEEEVQPPKLFKCINFQVPSPAGGLEEVGELEVEVRGQKLNRKKVLVKSVKNKIFVQTDKAVYKPGQTVKFRIVTLNEDFIPDHSPYPLVELQDPSSNRIGQWLDVSSRQGIADLSFPLSSEPAQGIYTIKVGNDVHHKFAVEEYVLPKFEVLIELPKVITILDELFVVKVCAKYTYGKPVQGQFEASLCRQRMLYNWYRSPQEKAIERCMVLSGKLERTGCVTKMIETSFYNMTEQGLMMSLDVKASVTEEGTDVTLSGSKSCTISSDIATVTFEDSEEYYKAGIPYTGKMKLSSAEGYPLIGETIYLFVENDQQRHNISYVTDDSGSVSFSLETGDWSNSVSMRGSYKLNQQPWEYGKVIPRYQDAYRWVKPFYSKSKSFMKLRSFQEELNCGQTQDVQLDYVIQRKELPEDASHVDLHYLVVSKGGLVHHGTKQLPVGQEDVLRGTCSIPLPVSIQLAPAAKLLVYIMFPDGEVAADTETFQISKCFINQVTLGFSQEEALPGADVTLQLQSAPGSLCAVRSVDKSTVLMKPEEELTAQKVYNLIRSPYFGGYPYQSEDYEPNQCSGFYGGFRGRRSYIMPWWHQSEPDVYSLLKEIGLKMITNANIRKPFICRDFPMLMSRNNAMPGMPGAAGPMGGFAAPELAQPDAMVVENNVLPDSAPKVEQQVRTYFPETWIWDLEPIGESGTTNMVVTVPDTITEWVAGAFCLADVGFGMSSPTTLRAFKPFFVTMALPYSVVRDESFTLKATVYNFLMECIKVETSLEKSEDFRLEVRLDAEYSSCLCAGEGKTFYWTVTAEKLGYVNLTVTTAALDTKEACGNEITVAPQQGRIDTLIKPILVKPGGVLEEKAHSSLICAEADSETSDVISVSVPKDILHESQRAQITVLGDIMGTALQNVDQLLAMPYGCGEQNMVKFAPNIYILQYLQKTNQLTREIKDKAEEYLKSGYQRELTYKHDDGSYSAFGKNDQNGNTWLTAFVMKSFGQAQPFIFVDNQHIIDAKRWLQEQQLESGCFRSVGQLFNNAMKGGVDDEISLCAYIAAALLELGTPRNDSSVDRALVRLKAALPNVTNVYTHTLLAYTFTLSGDDTERDQVMKELDQQAVKSVGQMHWQRKDRPRPKDEPYWFSDPSAEVEMTSYVLLAKLSKAEVSKDDIGTGSQTVSWLTKQQNPYGGFSSTQDTVVALQGLAKYCAVTYSEKGDVTVTVKSKAGFHQEFHVDNKNRLLLQQAALTEVPGDYTVSAVGKGCVYVQTTVRYNIPPPKSDLAFKLEVTTDPQECTEAARSKFSIRVTTSYTGDRTTSNMALIEVKMLSGFIPIKSSVRELEKDKRVKKVEIKPDQVTIYLDKLSQTPEQYTFSVEQDIEVKNLQPAMAIVYDYYEKADHALAEYNAPCSAEDESKTQNPETS